MALPWPPPNVPDFSKGTTAIFATGPSLTQYIANFCAMRVQHSITVNDAFRLVPWASIVYGCDSKWWNHPNNHEARNHKGLKVTCDDSLSGDWVYRLEETGKDGFDPTPGKLRVGHNSGYQALHLAASECGARRILLLGFDGGQRGGLRHYFGDHPEGLNQNSPFESFINAFRTLAPELVAIGCEVINCTPGSSYDAFPIQDLESSL